MDHKSNPIACLVLAALALPFTAALAADADVPEAADLSLSELYGFIVAKQTGLTELGFTADEQAEFMKGFKMGLEVEDIPGIQDRFEELQGFLQGRAEAAMEKEAAANAEAGAAFLAETAGQEGVETAEEGFLFKVIEPGNETMPTEEDTVLVHYTGRLPDGTVFDSSRERGAPARFPMNRVVPGFSGGLSKIGEGGKAEIYIPGDLGYGPNPPPGSGIPPNSVLIFDVELIEVDPEPANPGGGNGGS